MILLLGKDNDTNINRVIDWLNYYNCHFIRLDFSNEMFQNIEVRFENKKLNFILKTINGEILDFNEISYILFRGGRFNFNIDIELEDYNSVLNFLKLDYETLISFFYDKLQKKTLGYINKNPLNKLIQLEMASLVGLKIPKTLISNNKKTIKLFFDNNIVITKAIQENIFIENYNEILLQYVNNINLNSIKDFFFPSLFQEKIVPFFHVRSFYLDTKCYSIATIKTIKNKSIDHRIDHSSNVYTTFSLPKHIEKKIVLFMQKIKLVCGSIDFICDEKGNYYFLEVNPEGQYEWVSGYGNYELDEQIAKFLYEKEKSFKNFKR